ncbi:calmodulin-binding transcription activator 1-like isoform X2 [Mercenaria mercenaria]|uniref:calmodulin-binding transcription activator 1-like isoform X2 n=1 Tax=Mercenaria mercenaria TaxID=6596 RepID=UPI00234F5809|nr:calmodulin-binding transcription activator 1-like isoform X2 [Mercenaria mercenaria]
MMEIPVSIAVSNPQTQSTEEYIPSNIQLPKQLESVKAAQVLPRARHRWNTNEEIASILLAFSRHSNWQNHEVKQRPPSGCMFLFNRNSVRYRKDGYCWKKRKDGKTIREDHMKLKVQGLECIYGSYVHSAILPTFHRRCYWLLQNPDIVLVHYLNVPYPNNTKLSIPVMNFAMEKKEWTKEELVEQLKPMFSNIDGESLPVLDETIMTLVQRLMDNQDRFKVESPICGQSSQPHSSLSAPGGYKPLPVLSDKHDPRFPSSSLPHSASAITGQTHTLQNTLNLAQGPLILNIGNLGGSPMMLVTSQNDASQLSILTNTSNSGQLPNINSREVTSQITREVTSQVRDVPSQLLCRSASLCEPHDAINATVMARSQSQDSCNNGKFMSSQNLTDISFTQQQSQSSVSNNFHNVQTAEGTSNIQGMDVKHAEAKADTNPAENAFVQTNVQNPNANTFNALFSSNNSNGNSMVSSLLDELGGTDFMTADKYSPMEETKKGFDHLGDSFESLQGTFNTLQGSELTLDQLDLIDMPELERMCSDLTNTGDISELSNTIEMSTNQCQKTENPTNQKSENIQTNFSNLSGLNASSFSRNSSEQRESIGTVSSDADPSCVTCGTSRSQGQGQDSMVPPIRGRGDNLMHTTKTPCTIATITDFSPDWAYTEGQTKVLVTGPWHSNMGNYTVLLDGKIIATTLVQPGVLRCFVPSHQFGRVTLQVSCDGTVISNNVTFEYKERPKDLLSDTCSAVLDWFSVDDCKLVEQLLGKIERIETALSKVPDSPNIKQITSNVSHPSDMDVGLAHHLESLSSRLWTCNDLAIENGSMGLSLLHLAAGLGYSRFITFLIKWRNENPSWLLEYEVDAHSTDLNSCTPLMWACARGHTKTAVTLYNWNKGPLHSFNREGNLPLLVARQHGHHKLADQLEQIDSSHDMSHDLNSSRSQECTSTTSIYQTQTFENSQSMGKMCSNLDSVSTVRSTPEKTYFSTDFPAATSTSVTKDLSESTESVSRDPENLGSDNVLNALHIDIPSSNHQDVENAHKRWKLENPSHNIKPMLKTLPSSASKTITSTVVSSSASSLSTAEKRQKLQKRFSVDVISNQTLEPVHFSTTAAFQRPVREANSEPHLAANMEHLLYQTNPMLSDGRETGSPEMLVQLEHCERHGSQCKHDDAAGSQLDNMDTDNLSDGSNNSFVDVERISSDDEDMRRKMLTQGVENENPQPQMVHLAKQIIAAMPERIKSSPSRGDDIQPDEFQRERSSSYSSLQSSASPHAPSSYGEALSSYGEDSGISTPMHDSLAFDEYRYPDVYSDLGTPASSLSPDSTCLHSPYSPYTFHMDSPPPTAAEFIEYFNAPATFMEKDFSQLTLSDREQRKLYEAAKVIQSAYRQYKDKQCKQQAKEREAAVLIQSYYRRYKQYAYYKKMTQAAVLIQSQFRSYYAQKRFKKSRDAAVVIQNQYRSYKEHERLKKGGNKSVTQRFRSHYQRKPIGPGKGSRVVQIIPDTEGQRHYYLSAWSQAEAANIPIDDCPQDTIEEAETSTEDQEQTEVTLTENTQGE